MNYIPFFATLLKSGTAVVDKALLNIKGITYKNFSTISFFAALVTAIIVFLIIKPPLTTTLFDGYLGWLVIFTTLTILITNLIYYYALKKDLLSEVEMLSLVSYLPIILFSSLVFTDERNVFVLLPATVASLAIIWSHWAHHRMAIKHATKIFVWWTLIMVPLEAAAFKVLLTAWHPVSLQLVREMIIVPILGFLYAKNMRRISTGSFLTIFFNGAISTLATILFFLSYQEFGVVYTTLIFSLEPFLVYFSSLFFLKEKVHAKKVIAFIIVLASIAIAQL